MAYNSLFTGQQHDDAASLLPNSQVVTLGGDFDNVDVKCVRIGDVVTITPVGGVGFNSSTSNAISSAGAIPATYRPSTTSKSVASVDGYGFTAISAGTGGEYGMTFYDHSGNLDSRPGSDPGLTITYVV